MPPIVGVLGIFAVAWLAGSLYVWLAEGRRKSCDGCRSEAAGSASFVMHTCSKRRAFYRDKRGNVYEFGKPRKEKTPYASRHKEA